MRAFQACHSHQIGIHMEAERLNSLASQLDDLDSRTKELRRYL
jgi:hypothetical protein